MVGQNAQVSEERRRLPPWLVGLIVAVIVFAVLLVLLQVLGYGDDPSIGSQAVSLPTEPRADIARS